MSRRRAQPRADKRQEVMLHVYWSALNDKDDDGRGHLVQRDRVTADLGLDVVPDPPFTPDEMQKIMFAAKFAAKTQLARRVGKATSPKKTTKPAKARVRGKREQYCRDCGETMDVLEVVCIACGSNNLGTRIVGPTHYTATY